MLSRLAFAAVSVALLAACPHSGGGDGTGPGTGKGTATTPIDAGVAELPERTPGNPLLPPEGIDPQPLACVYHAAAAGYFTCTNANAGTCFHFGAPCAPKDACMFDAGSKKYKTCATIVQGTCTAWGAACSPANACMFDPEDSLHRTCDTVDDGACKAWGGLCDPG